MVLTLMYYVTVKIVDTNMIKKMVNQKFISVVHI